MNALDLFNCRDGETTNKDLGLDKILPYRYNKILYFLIMFSLWYNLRTTHDVADICIC